MDLQDLQDGRPTDPFWQSETRIQTIYTPQVNQSAN